MLLPVDRPSRQAGLPIAVPLLFVMSRRGGGGDDERDEERGEAGGWVDDEVDEGSQRWPLTARDLARLRSLFEAFAEEPEADGEAPREGAAARAAAARVVTAESLRMMIARGLGIRAPLEKCQEVINLWCDGSSMDFEAFLSFYAARFKELPSAEELRSVFHMLKENPRDNRVPAASVAHAVRELSGVSEKRVLTMFKQAFPGRDPRKLVAEGELSYEEFSQFMR
jgi:Ca2+-binding EF-hand superfamily protein